jgi:two-component system NarL family sensor kinase
MEAADWSIVVQENERQRVASDLHDGLGQILTLLTMELGNAADAAKAPGGFGVASAINRAADYARSAINELRRSIMNLYPTMLDDLGLAAALSSLIREIRAAEPAMAITAHLAIADQDVPIGIQIPVFRIVQEALNNVLKHARARTLTVRFELIGGTIWLTIQDDGKGIGADQQNEVRHRSGVAGMIRRAKVSGGDLDLHSEEGRGTTVQASWALITRYQGLAECI